MTAVLTQVRGRRFGAAFAALVGVAILLLLVVPLDRPWAARPNFVVIQTDDQNAATVRALMRGSTGPFHRVMPNAVKKIVNQGTEFRNYYASSPLCSPSRASLLSGQYPWNNGVIANLGQNGGWNGWRNHDIMFENLPVTLNRHGYRTSHFGKFTNDYYDGKAGQVDRTVPPGWDRWFTTAYEPGTRFYGYELNIDGRAVGPVGNPDYRQAGPGTDAAKRCKRRTLRRVWPTGRCRYLGDVMTAAAVREIRQYGHRPFYLQIDYQAPHGDVARPRGPQPATRHLGTASRTPLPRPPSFNERNFGDKPALVRALTPWRMDRREVRRLQRSYRRYLESLRSVDDGIGSIMRTLRRTGRLHNTYVFLLSDHGLFLGEHRYDWGKFLPYEASSSPFMAVRGPGVRRGRVSREVVGNVDVPVTMMRLAGARPDYPVDGRSLKPFWRQPWRHSRRAMPIVILPPRRDKVIVPRAQAVNLAYRGFRVGRYKYIRYMAGGQELYDLARDPHELRNRARRPAYFRVVRWMRKRLNRVTDCDGQECRKDLRRPPRPGFRN